MLDKVFVIGLWGREGICSKPHTTGTPLKNTKSQTYLEVFLGVFGEQVLIDIAGEIVQWTCKMNDVIVGKANRPVIRDLPAYSKRENIYIN